MRNWLRALAGTVMTISALTAAAPARADSSSVPYSDPAQQGFLGFCDATGHAVSGGSLDTIPFVWRAVSSAAAPPPYAGRGQEATLYAYQPRPGVEPSLWSGEALTASSLYTNSAHPMAQGDRGEISLGQFVSDYPPQWSGLVQLRLYFGRPGYQERVFTYPAADLRISGKSWSVVRGTSSNFCATGKAISVGALLAPKAAKGKLGGAAAPTPARNVTVTGASASQGSAGASSGNGSPAAAAGSGNQSTSTADAGNATGNRVWVTPILIGLVLAAAVVGGAAATRRLRRTPTSSTEHRMNPR